ncbi:MAG TPA: sigma factor-like helix-turn-helix DNA-binding protein, partial [Gaiellaceae bacterium]
AVQALDPELREAVALHHGAGLSTPEIAAVLDRTEDDVDVILHRARDALRKEMAALADIPWQKPL